jgi:hypothetical protein
MKKPPWGLEEREVREPTMGTWRRRGRRKPILCCHQNLLLLLF